jgi:hypothetical protein
MTKQHAIYMRVSTKRQDTASQGPELRRWAEAHEGDTCWFCIRGWHLGRGLDQELTLTALRRAYEHGRPKIHHCDQGVQYAATAYVEMLIGREVKISMASVGEPEEKDYTSSCTSFVFSGEALGNRSGSVLLIPCCLSGLFVPTGSYRYSGLSL